jgi:hypothetical protein
MIWSLRKRWWLGLLVLGVGAGCGGAQPPTLGENLVFNGSFESGLDGWWQAGGDATPSADAADSGAFGLTLHKGSDGWGSMVGQETRGHTIGQTYQIYARLKGAVGGERVTFRYHGQGFEVVADSRWRTVNRMVLMPEINGDTNALVAVTTNDATVYVDEVSFAQAIVARGDADKEDDNLLRNGSFESDLGLWDFWTDSPDGSASTSPDARHSGYAGMVLTRGGEGSISSVKQPLPDPVASREKYRIEANVRGAHGGEVVNVCLQINHEPWDGPCAQVTAAVDWQHLSQEVSIDDAIVDERVGALVSLSTPGTVMVDDVIVVRTRSHY